MTTEREIYLCKEHVSLLHMMIRGAEIQSTNRNSYHEKLSDKIFRCRLARTVRAIVTLDHHERRVLRQYNTDFCERMVKTLINAEEEGTAVMSDWEIRETYLLATEIQFLIS